ncbi:MAG: Nif3-like dinuclear metal center hexameric protein [Acutalibacteraceae bacterium]|nr:Nif3-like dinuclear metal center hexameric protein [Acutalibacteraceae bacterium]
MTVKDVLTVLDNFAPFDTQLDFDNSGLLVGNENDSVTKIGIALDATNDVINKAVNSNCDLLITHHPIIFDALKQMDTSSLPALCIKKGLNVISVHTNFDIAKGGVNDCLAKKLELENVQPLSDMARVGYKHFENATCFAKFLKEKLDCSVKFTNVNAPIEKIAICGGSGACYMQDAIINNCDALVTGEAKHNNRIDAVNLDFALFECGHFNTEKFIKEKIYEILSLNNFCCEIIEEKDPAEYI